MGKLLRQIIASAVWDHIRAQGGDPAAANSQTIKRALSDYVQGSRGGPADEFLANHTAWSWGLFMEEFRDMQRREIDRDRDAYQPVWEVPGDAGRNEEYGHSSAGRPSGKQSKKARARGEKPKGQAERDCFLLSDQLKLSRYGVQEEIRQRGPYRTRELLRRELARRRAVNSSIKGNWMYS
jgi:hypothetical protein